MDQCVLQRGEDRATVAAPGAELQGLRLGGLDLLWEGGPLWPRHAPLLFPIVGALTGDTLRLGGRTHALPRHGFARDRAFRWLDRTGAACTLVLGDDAGSREAYPFPFRLEVAYSLERGALVMRTTLQNPGPAPLPASFGLHPAFRWPLVAGQPKGAHRIVFEGDPGPLRRLDARGLVAPEVRPAAHQDGILPLAEALFREDAMLYLEGACTGLRFEVPGGPSLRLAWEGFPHLGLWAKPDPGPSFLCLEPWDGHASPAGWDGSFDDKPGTFKVAPGQGRTWSMTLSVA